MEHLDTGRQKDRLGSKQTAKVMDDTKFMELVKSFVKTDMTC